LRDEIQGAKYVVGLKRFITLSSVKSQSVIILGEVKSPGLFNSDIPLTSLQLVAMPGGFTAGAKLEIIFLVTRG
jgi:protein involved in polysaccharide export with SLBB domain